MSEAANVIENQEDVFNHRCLTPFESILLGDTIRMKIDGEEVLLDSELFKKLWADPEKRDMLLTPPIIAEGNKSLEETKKIRTTESDHASPELKLWLGLPREYIQEDLVPFLSLGELNSAARLEIIGVFFCKGVEKIDPPENAHEQIKFNLGLDSFVEYAGNTNGVIQYRINPKGK
jgi:hypothetical protein